MKPNREVALFALALGIFGTTFGMAWALRYQSGLL